MKLTTCVHNSWTVFSFQVFQVEPRYITQTEVQFIMIEKGTLKSHAIGIVTF